MFHERWPQSMYFLHGMLCRQTTDTETVTITGIQMQKMTQSLENGRTASLGEIMSMRAGTMISVGESR